MKSKLAILISIITFISCTPGLVKEEITRNRITVMVQADIVLETEDMDMKTLTAYMITKGRKRASSILTARYISRTGMKLGEYKPLDLSPCLKDEKVIRLEETQETVDCTVSFRMDDCERAIEDGLSGR